MPAEDIVWAREDHGWDLACEAVRRRPEDIVLVPEKALSPHVCAEAVRRKGALLQAVPEGMRTPFVCLLAVLQDPGAAEFVPAARKERILEVSGRIRAGRPEDAGHARRSRPEGRHGA